MIQGSDPPVTLRPDVQSLVAQGPRHIPTELLHDIITFTLSQYLSNVLIAPVSTKGWDAIGSLLHVDYHFRSCTLRILNDLWDGNFVDHGTGHPRDYTHKIKYLRQLAQLAQTHPKQVLPPFRHVLCMRPNTAPYERLGRYFIMFQAHLNKYLADDRPCNLYDDMSNLALGFSALPMGLRDRILSEFVDYVVSNLLVWVRALSFRALVTQAVWSVKKFSEENVVPNYLEPRLYTTWERMQKVREVAGSLGREKDGVECGLLSHDAVSKDLFETLLPEMRRLQVQGGTGGAFYNAWMSILGVLLTSKERETYGIASVAFQDDTRLTVRANKDKEALGESESFENFHPTFTYPIYGEDENIYGYSDLVIDLRFASGSLAQFLDVRYSAKVPSSSTVDDVQGTLEKYIPDDYYRTESEFLARVEEDAVSFRPPGEKIASYTRIAPDSKKKGKGAAVTLLEDDPDAIVYEVWHVTWNSPGFREYHRRMQLFILLYIEAGSYINDVEDSWEFVVLYEKRKRRTTPVMETYHFIGYSSLYPFYCFPDKVRLRLSQFVIIPPYQHQGHGSALYRAIYEYVLSKPSISELTVEDPAEAFEDLRDRNDLAMLLGHTAFISEGFGDAAVSHGGGRVGRTARTAAKGKGRRKVAGGKLGPPADRAWLERWRKDLKIAGRQFHRLVEMLIQLHLNPADTRAAKAYRLQVKERLYRFNYEILAQLEEKERLEKLEETFQSVCGDYRRILAMVR